MTLEQRWVSVSRVNDVEGAAYRDMSCRVGRYEGSAGNYHWLGVILYPKA